MAQASFYKIKAQQLASLPIREGQIIFTDDNGKLYIDASDSVRTLIDTTYGLSLNNGVISIVKDSNNSSINLPDGLDPQYYGSSLDLTGNVIELKNINGVKISEITIPAGGSAAIYWTVDGIHTTDGTDIDWLDA